MDPIMVELAKTAIRSLFAMMRQSGATPEEIEIMFGEAKDEFKINDVTIPEVPE